MYRAPFDDVALYDVRETERCLLCRQIVQRACELVANAQIETGNPRLRQVGLTCDHMIDNLMMTNGAACDLL